MTVHEQAVALPPCPFCGGAMQPRHALWPSEGDVDGIIHASPTDCPLPEFSVGVADEGVSVAAAWNKRALPLVGVREDGARTEELLTALNAANAGNVELLDRVSKLNAENFELAAGACHGGYGDEFGNWRCKYQDQIASLVGVEREDVAREDYNRTQRPDGTWASDDHRAAPSKAASTSSQPREGEKP